MQPLVGTLIVGAILMVSSMSNVDGWQTRSDFCKTLDRYMRQSKENFRDSTATYKLAHSIIPKLRINLDSPMLDAAWQAVTFDQPCTSKSHEFVGAIHECRPDRFDSMRYTLGVDVRKYVRKCFLYLGSLTRALRTVMDYPTGVELLLSNQFIESYISYNYGQSILPANDFETCRPEYSEQALVESITILLKTRGEDAKSYFERYPHKLKGFLEENLFNPCKRYVKQVDSVMRTVMMLEDMRYRLVGTKVLVGVPKDFRNAIFRYKFCKRFEEDKDTAVFSRMVQRFT